MAEKTPNKKNKVSRRDFLGDAAKGVCGAGLFGLALGSVVAEAEGKLPADAIRPPGATAEADFLSACVRCGLCVRDCPYDTLSLADMGSSVVSGTPLFVARTIPCEMCDDIPCVVACPTGALDKSLTNIDDAKMGIAVLVGHETCLNFQGLRCDVCYRVCPLIEEAITLERSANERTGKHAIFIPTVHSDKCTGCGKCEHACVLEKTAIRVLPERIALGELGAHYRWGWVEKGNKGESLIEGQGIIDLPDRGYNPEPSGFPEKSATGGYKGFKP
ncbi:MULTISPECIES: ferredoxin-type protein NapG [Terasakiella]|uniref:Ferredoxin-type protein NapG n=1 Tax=Terasakiella brassicae TaxID=1634917 RepID=A0A917C4Q4_9PROT|nr:ferredoxin-type protein NapG [Terasakiella brassicae]GGF71938.1 ferredoxin-type protein NapG [Terasakiella brassicae]